MAAGQTRKDAFRFCAVGNDVGRVSLPSPRRPRFDQSLWRFSRLLLFALTVTRVDAAPSIQFTYVPPFGSFDNLAGQVLDVSPSAYSVAVFIYVPGAGWWSKPFCDPQLTGIGSDGSWTADITTGGSDQDATWITALVVSTNYNQPCVEGLASLPPNVTTQAIASTTVFREDPSLRWIHFSGYDWWVKSSTGLVGPGPNYFSDSTNNLWLDDLGQLHLRITNRSNQWQCAELVTARTFGYGKYRFALGSSVDDINLNAVLGLFTWSDDPAYAHREIDIECSRWSNASDANNAQYVVQPWDTPGHLARFAVPAGQTNSIHQFTWETNRVTFQSQLGDFDASANPANQITNWLYTLDTPQTGDENVRINLWLNSGNPPVGNTEVEVNIRSFEFVPLGTPQPATISNASQLPSGQVHFFINGQVDWRYQVQFSTNLLDWQPVATLLATNNMMDFLDSSGSAAANRFFRTLTVP